MDCLFCKIIAGEIKASKIYEDEKVLSFLDIAPVSKGHALVIHKKHTESLFDSEKEIISDIGKALPRIASAVKKATGADGISIAQNNGKAAGQAIFHVHFHVIPRYEGDGLKLWPQGRYKEGEIEETAHKIGSHIQDFE